MVWGVSHFHTYLYGQRVTVYTDHAVVKGVLQSTNTRHDQWVHGARPTEVNIVYRVGKEPLQMPCRESHRNTLSFNNPNLSLMYLSCLCLVSSSEKDDLTMIEQNPDLAH